MKITFLVSGNVRSNFVYRALSLARALRSQGHDVSIIAPKADKYNDFKPEEINAIDGVRILQPFQFATKHPEINLLPYLLGAAKLVVKEKPDLVYIYKPTPVNVIGFMSKLLRKTPVVVDFDDLGSEVMKIEGHPWYQQHLVSWSEMFAAKYADRLVVASTYLFNNYKKEFPDKSIHIMPNGIEGDWLSPLIVSKEQKRIIFMGSINRTTILEPLFEVLPEIIKKHPDVKIIIMGAGKCLEYFKQKVEVLHIASEVEFTGWLDIGEARSHLCAGDIGYNYMPNEKTIQAASNMKVPQYMARGVVPLVSDVGDLPATVDFGNAGYICTADNVEALKITLLHALEDGSRLQKAEQAHSIAVKKLNWNFLASDLSRWLHPMAPKKEKKIYIVATAVPGDIGGGEIRNYNLIKQWVKQTPAQVEVFCIAPGDPEAASRRFASQVSALCHAVPSSPRSPRTMMRAMFMKRVPPFMDDFNASGLGDMFRKACEESLPDIVQIEQIHAYYCVRPHIAWLKSQGVKIIFDCHNIEFQSFEDSLGLFSLSKKLMGKFLVPHLKYLEIEATRYADLIFACSESDAAFFRNYNPMTHVIPNGVDCSEFRPDQKDQNGNLNLIFMGAVQYPPNGDAMKFYLDSIHPKVKQQTPNIKLLAIGTGREWLNGLAVNDESVEPLGFVDDVRPYLQKATIGICPIRYGSGTRIKIMTYMAAGLPVVSTSKGAEGVTYVNGRDIIITDDPKEFAEAILRLLHNKAYRDEIARNGWKFISEHYDWNVIGKKLAHLYEYELR